LRCKGSFLLFMLLAVPRSGPVAHNSTQN
jgi:hypothetical protein